MEKSGISFDLSKRSIIPARLKKEYSYENSSYIWSISLRSYLAGIFFRSCFRPKRMSFFPFIFVLCHCRFPLAILYVPQNTSSWQAKRFIHLWPCPLHGVWLQYSACNDTLFYLAIRQHIPGIISHIFTTVCQSRLFQTERHLMLIFYKKERTLYKWTLFFHTILSSCYNIFCSIQKIFRTVFRVC